jgi:hypothetical protein
MFSLGNVNKMSNKKYQTDHEPQIRGVSFQIGFPSRGGRVEDERLGRKGPEGVDAIKGGNREKAVLEREGKKRGDGYEEDQRSAEATNKSSAAVAHPLAAISGYQFRPPMGNRHVHRLAIS